MNTKQTFCLGIIALAVLNLLGFFFGSPYMVSAQGVAIVSALQSIYLFRK